MGGENNPFLGVGESLYYTGYLCYTVAMLQTFEGGIFVYEKLIILNTLVYSVWCFYFSRQILKERFTPVKTAVIILLTHVVIILGGRRLFPNGILFILVHTASILSIFLWHYGSVKRKLLTYCLYTGMVMLLELLIMSFFSFVQKLLYHRLSSMIGEISVQTSTDLIIISITFLIIGNPICKIIADFTGAVSKFSSIVPIVQIIFPYYWFCIVLSMIYAFNVPFGSFLFLFAAITVPVVPIFISGIRNLYIQEFEAQWRNRKNKRAGKAPFEPLYTTEDAMAVMEHFVPCDYMKEIEVCEGVKIRFTDVGHLLGSSSIEIWLTENGVSKKIVFSGKSRSVLRRNNWNL